MMTAIVSLPREEIDRPAALRELADIAKAATELYLDEVDSQVGVRSTRELLRELLTRTIHVLRSLQPPNDDEATNSETDDLVGDLCFGGALELGHVLRNLLITKHDEEILVAIEGGRRKLLRVTRAIARAARDHRDSSPPREAAFDDEVEAACAVRRAYAELRRSLRQPTDDSPEAVLVAMRYAVGGLATLVASPVYREVRIQDRLVLRSLRDRALAWAQRDKSTHEGLRLLQDVFTCTDLLRGINRRQDLRAHDEAKLQTLVAGPHADRSGWWTSLRALEGLDDELDALIEAARRSPTTADLAIAPICARLATLGERAT